MNTPTAYTPLECLLLFQSLVQYGAEDKSFVQISDLLTNNDLVKEGETYDPARLRSDALRELYLQLLREELKSEQDGHSDGTQSTSRKRKLQSPALPTIKDALEYKEKLPILVDRLYGRYRDHIVRGIREDEREYAELQKEISELEKIEEDDRILKEDSTIANKNGSLSPKDVRPKTNGTSPIVPPKEKQLEALPSPALPAEPSLPVEIVSHKTPAAHVTSPRVTARPEGLGIDNLVSQVSPAPLSPTVDPRSPNGAADIPPSQQSPAPNGPHGPSPLQPPQQPGIAYKWEPAYQAGPPQQPQYQGQPYQQYPPQYSPQSYPPPRGSFPPHGVPPHLRVPSSPHSSQSPVLAPPSGTIRRSSSSSGMDALADLAGQQYRAPSGSPMQQQGPFTPGACPPPYPPQQRPTPGTIPPNGPQWNQQYMPTYPGSPQQFYPPPTNQRPPFPPQPNILPAENRQYNSPYNPSQGPRPSMPTSGPNTPRQHQMPPGTPLNQGFPMRTTGSGTRWTYNPLTASSPAIPYTIVPSPAVEPLSPVLSSAKASTGKKLTKKAMQTPDVPKLRGKPGPKPGSKRGAQKMQAASTESPIVTGARRSMSVTSHTDHPDELSLDVKEEVQTPLPLGEEETGDTTADESSLPPRQLMSRPKRPTQLTTSPAAKKRKRAESHLSTPSTPREVMPLPTHVLWTRNFAKISTSAMETVVGHRHASLFANPIKERDAPGYSKIILRPQDLKTIKSAISAGQRAALEKEKSLGSEISRSDSSIWLPISEDLVPPKGIINYAQLEKELMRMFANAIMFNADPARGFGDRLGSQKDKKGGEGYEFDEDGVVKDTRDMQQYVEKWIGDLRAAEQMSKPAAARGSSVGRGGSVARGGSLARGSSVRDSSIAVTEDEVDELAGDVGEVASNAGGSVAKRRRKAAS